MVSWLVEWVGPGIPAMCRRCLTLVRLKPWAAVSGGGGGAFLVGGDQVGDVALIEAVE